MGIEQLRADEKRWAAMFNGGVVSSSSNGHAKPLARNAIVECIHRGEQLPRETWPQVACKTCCGGEPRMNTIILYECSQFRECTMLPKVQDIACCNDNGNVCKQRATFIMPEGAIVMNATRHGIGDSFITAWIAEGSKGTSREMVHYATGQKAELLRLFGQTVIDYEVADMKDTFTPGGREAAGMRVTRLQHRAAYLQAGGTPRRPQLIELSKAAKNFAESVAGDNTVPLFPQAAHAIRVWPAAYWVELSRLLTLAGWKPLFLLNVEDSDFAKCERHVGLCWEYILAIVQRTRLAVTNSSGPAHVLGTMNHPTLVVCGPTDPHVAFGHLDSLRCVYEESMDCVRCHYHGPKVRPACRIGCEALHRLSPTTVMAEAAKMLGGEPLHEVADGMWRQVSQERVEYDDAYFDRFDEYRGTEIHRRLIAARVDFVRKYGCESSIDVGIGAGTFVEAMDCHGFDVMPKAVAWLKDRGKYRSPYEILGNSPDAITCWDSLEHIEHPNDLLECVRPGRYLFVSLPIFRDLDDIMGSKHYRPGEHLTYWTADGLKAWCARHGLTCVAENQMETDIGREAIGTFVFRRNIVAKQPAAPPPIDQTRPLVIRSGDGIGDLCWLFATLGNAEPFNLVLPLHGNHRDRRAEDFASRFDFVRSVRSERFAMHTPHVANRIGYMPAGYGADGSYTLHINPFVEWDYRLDEIFPGLEPCWDFMDRYQRDDTAQKIHGRYVVVHPGCLEDNTVRGQNGGGMWSVRDWRRVITSILDAGRKVLIVGAEYDDKYAKLVSVGDAINLCGMNTVPQTVEILRGAELVIGFPSGIPILSTYLHVPTLMFWRDPHRPLPASQLTFGESFATNWVPPRAMYVPLWFGRDDADEVIRVVQESLTA